MMTAEINPVVSVDVKTILTALIAKKHVKFLDVTFTIPILPKSTFYLNRKTEEGMVMLLIEELLSVSHDGALSVTTYIDGELKQQNSYVLQQTYASPQKWTDFGLVIPVFRVLTNEITNYSAELVKLTLTTRYALITRAMYDSVFSRYFDRIVDVVTSSRRRK